MNKEYKEVEFMTGSNIETCVSELLEYKEKGELAYCIFNEHKLYSDTVSLDGAYKLITGKTKKEFDNYLKEQNEKYIKQRQEHEESIPEQTKFWIEEGKKVLDESKWEYWEEIVPVRLIDLYQGMELKNCLDVIKILKTGTLEDAKKEINSQSHSGTSYSLVRLMVREFSLRGEEFFDYIK